MPNYPSPFPFPLLRGETSTSFVQFRNARVVADAVAQAETDDALRVESIHHLDFEPDVMCDAREVCPTGDVDHPADFWVSSHCVGPLPVCGGEIVRASTMKPGRCRCVVCNGRMHSGPYLILGPVR